MKLTLSDLFRDISDGVLAFSGFISFLMGFSIGLVFDKLLTDQVEWIELSLIEVLFGKLPTIVVLGFLSLRSCMLLQWSHLNTKNFQFVFTSNTKFIFTFAWISFLAWVLFNFLGLFGYWLGLEVANHGNSSEHIQRLLIEFDWTASINGLERLFLESILLSILILFENSSTFFKFNDPIKGLFRSFLILFSSLLILEFLGIYLFL